MHRLLFLPILYIFIACGTPEQEGTNEDSSLSIPPEEEQIIFAELLSEKSEVKPENVQVDLHGNFFLAKLKKEENYSICIDTISFNINPKETYIKLINMESFDQFDMFMNDSLFHAPFKEGTLHSVEFKSEDQIITQIKNFEGLLKTFRSYKKENGAWKMISAGFYTYKQEYVHPFNK